jgi:hypothetical protein
MMLYSRRLGMSNRWLVITAACFAAILGSVSSNAVAQSTTLYFSGDCTDCVGTGNLALTTNLSTDPQITTPATVAYSSSILGNLTDTNAELFAGLIDATTLPSGQFTEISFSANDNLYTFTSCGSSSVIVGASSIQNGNEVCGSAADVANHIATLGYGDWEVSLGIFSTSSGLPGGAGTKVQDYGTNGVWSTVAPTDVVAAPEIDANSAVAALMLLLGGLAVARGKRTLATARA